MSGQTPTPLTDREHSCNRDNSPCDWERLYDKAAKRADAAERRNAELVAALELFEQLTGPSGPAHYRAMDRIRSVTLALLARMWS